MGKKKAYLKSAHLFSGENNQFRMKFNRTKNPVLNAKVKGSKGNRVMSKGIAYAKRKEQWEKKQIAAKKANRFIDKRLLDPSMSLEDQASVRFVRERQKISKRNKFNLNDDEEELTHKGKPLHDLNDWDKNASESEEETALDEDFVSKAHFGGFASDSNFETPKTHKELIEQLISESKLKKQEQKMEKEKYINSQEKVDMEWKEIHMMTASVNSSSSLQPKKVIIQAPEPLEEKDEYDITKSELKFEPKSSSITHIKTPEEIAIQEEEKRIQREKERLIRMMDPEEPKAHNNFESADALCEEYDYLLPITPEDNEKNFEDVDEKSDNDVSMDEDDDDEESFMENDESSTCGIPQDVESFMITVQDCTAEEIGNVVGDLLKNTIRSKDKSIKFSLVNFFDVLLHYALDCCESSDTEKAGVLLPHLHSLAEAEPKPTAMKFLKCMDEEQQLFQECKSHWKKFKSSYPRIKTLTILRFAGLIYSVSDRVHPVALPAMDFMSDILSSKFAHTYDNVVSRLLVCNIWLNYVKDSKKLVPEIINFLNCVCKLAIPEKTEGDGNKKFNLILNDKSTSEKIGTLNVIKNKKSPSDVDKIAIIYQVISQINQLVNLYTDLLSFKSLFASSLTLCNKLPVEYYPIQLQNSIKAFVEFVKNKSVVLRHLTFPKTRPKSLKMFEPAFDSRFNKKDNIVRKRKLLKKISQKIKKEEKGMVREVRQEAQMVAAEKLKKTLESDAERKRKVKEIYAQLAEQEGEYKKMMKKK